MSSLKKNLAGFEKALAPSGAVDSRVTYYEPQMTAYRDALVAATGASVSATLLFLNPQTSVAVPL